MSKRQTTMLLGVWVMILFMTGFPAYVKEFLALVTGVAIILVASRIKADDKPARASSVSYVENRRPVSASAPTSTPASAPANPPLNNPTAPSQPSSTPSSAPTFTNREDQVTP